MLYDGNLMVVEAVYKRGTEKNRKKLIMLSDSYRLFQF